VVGGDCSILLGCLAGARRSGPAGLIHIDGHSDFFHPGNYDTVQRLGSAAGMDLALATGRGEAILAQWNVMPMPLVADADVVQVGEREERDPDYAFKDIEDTAIRQITVRKLKTIGIERTAQDIEAYLLARRLERIWLHVDVDVLDEREMPAVDSPGRPGLTYGELSELLARICSRLPIIGANVTVFDPDLDPAGHYAKRLADCLAGGLRTLATAA
jgi:arginase